MKTFSLLLLFGFIQQVTFSQSGIIEGRVIDNNNKGIAGATVTLLNAKDSSLLKTTTTANTGRFGFTAVDTGAHLVSITSVGYNVYVSRTIRTEKAGQVIKLPVIVLSSGRSEELKTVTVAAKRPVMENQLDKTVVNVQSMITAASSNTLEVLERIPGITVDRNGEISLNGRSGILVLIDGRATYMSAQDLAAYLRSLPGSLLDKVELMDNPPAKYDAGGAAVINIKLKKNREAGVTGNVALGYNQGVYGRTNNSVSVNYHRKKINLFTNIGINGDKTFTTDLYDRRLFDEEGKKIATIDLDNRQVYRTRNLNVNVGMDYAASDKTTFGFGVNVNRGKRRGRFDYESETFGSSADPLAGGMGLTNSRETRTNLGGNLNMQHRFGKNKELTVDFNYLNYDSKNDRDLTNAYFDRPGMRDSASQFSYRVPTAAEILVAKADYVHTLKGDIKLEAGMKWGLVKNDNTNNFYDAGGIDYSQSNQFRYNENVNAVYASAQKMWNRWGVQLGMRAENTNAKGDQPANQLVEGSSFSRHYTDFFPSMFVSYKLDSNGNDNFSLAITRRINRPNYQLLNPFVFFKDEYSYTSGNPLLGPQFQYRTELKYQHRQWLSMGLSYNRFTNVIFPTTQAVNDILITRSSNVGKGYMVLLNMGINVPVTKWWQLNTMVRTSYIGLNGVAYTEKLDLNTFVLRLEMMNYFTIAKCVNAELGGYFASRDFTGQTITGGMYRINAALQKKIMNDRATIKLSVDDMLYSWVYKNRSVSLKQMEYLQTGFSDSQRFGVAFTYRFGKDSFARKRKQGDGGDEEKGRLE